MATPELRNSFQHVSLTSDESETEPRGDQLPMELDEAPPPGRLPRGHFPADTPLPLELIFHTLLPVLPRKFAHLLTSQHPSPQFYQKFVEHQAQVKQDRYIDRVGKRPRLQWLKLQLVSGLKALTQHGCPYGLDRLSREQLVIS